MSYQALTPYGKLRAAMAACERSVLFRLRNGNEVIDGYTLSPAESGAATLKGYLRVKGPNRWRRCLSIATRFYQRALIRAEAAAKDAAGIPRNMPGLPQPISTYA